MPCVDINKPCIVEGQQKSKTTPPFSLPFAPNNFAGATYIEERSIVQKLRYFGQLNILYTRR